MMTHSLALQWDVDYGMNHRKGWTVIWDGSVMVELTRPLPLALWRAWRRYRMICTDKEGPHYKGKPPKPKKEEP